MVLLLLVMLMEVEVVQVIMVMFPMVDMVFQVNIVGPPTGSPIGTPGSAGNGYFGMVLVLMDITEHPGNLYMVVEVLLDQGPRIPPDPNRAATPGESHWWWRWCWWWSNCFQ